MDSCKTDRDLDCDFCKSVTLSEITYTTDCSYEDASERALIRNQLLHEPCPQCDAQDLNRRVELCARCQHLRIWHIIGCLNPASLVLFLNLSTNGGKCDFCHFMISCLAKRFGESQSKSFFRKSGWIQWPIYRFGTGTYQISGSVHSYRKGLCVIGLEEVEAGPSAQIDWSWLRCWLPQLLARREGHKTIKGSPRYKSICEVRVIDVFKACIIHLPLDAPYVALSYVWGENSVADFRTLRSNVDRLSLPGSLDNIHLPRTILDAMTACEALGNRYLWVDRLCIIQDEVDANSIQLKQMASLYHQAIFTIVAAEGSSAACGLSGVSRIRDEQGYIELQNGVKLVKPASCLQEALSHSARQGRGWTYQEHNSSSNLVFFTDDGIYVEQKSRDQKYIFSELSNAEPDSEPRGIETFLTKIQEYTERTLTYPSDILRAFSGILEATYGDRTSFGLAWEEFDRAILWVQDVSNHKSLVSTATDVFPSWSWISAKGKVSFRHPETQVYSLAYWCRTVQSNKTSTNLAVGGPYALASDFYDRDIEPYISAGLAWANGCIRSTPPEHIEFNCSKTDYSDRLRRRWPHGSATYWHEAFQGYDEEELFKEITKELSGVTGRIMVQTQKASFTLDRACRRFYEDVVLIRSNGRIAGMVEPDMNTKETILTLNMDQSSVDCIALSIPPDSLEKSRIWQQYQELTKFSRISELYGCFCSLEEGAGTANTDHLVECPKHADFLEMMPFHRNEKDSFLCNSAHGMAFSKHMADLSYLDINGELLHDLQKPPFLYVMLIVPSPTQGKRGIVYQRLGLARIYLKRWVEASPKFESIVLE